MQTPIIIDPITDYQSFLIIEDLQRQIWGMTNEREIVPAHIIAGLARNGGLVLGAYQANELAGFSLSWKNSDDEGEYHYLHMLGTLALLANGEHPYGIGTAIMYELKRRLEKKQVSRLRWTFDPLQSRNASLYVRKLHADIVAYKDDYYGEMEDDRNRGLPSDRFIAEWDLYKISDKRSCEQWLDAQFVNPCIADPSLENGKCFILQNPVDVGILSDDEKKQWRMRSRVWFHWLLENNWQIVDYILRDKEAGYLFAKK